MKRMFARSSCAAVLALIGTHASAVPLYFNFTGTVNQANGSFAGTGLEGTAVSGGFVFETENLTRMESPDLGLVQFFSLSASGPYAFLNIASQSFVFPVYPQGNTQNILFFDTVCPPTAIRCDASEYEHLDLYARSLDVDFETSYSPTFAGTYRDAVMSVNAWEWSDAEYFDWTTAGPEDIASLPLPSISGYFAETTYRCGVETFCMPSDDRNFGFTIDSVTRGVGPSVSVPEPGALGLVGAAGFALLLFGRRRRLR